MYMLIYKKTQEIFPNRKAAKTALGHAKYNKAVDNGEITYISYGETDIVL